MKTLFAPVTIAFQTFDFRIEERNDSMPQTDMFELLMFPFPWALPG
jgi:hypothetical protein